jgi:hypothetical protein
MKTMKISKRLELSVNDDSQMYGVKIDNITKKVVYHSSDYSPISLEQIQKLVDKLMRLKMITLFGEGTTEVSINIWNIDSTDDLYIETYHNGGFDDVTDFDRIMEYEKFLDN